MSRAEKILQEGKKYPSQYDAEMMVEYASAVNNLSSGGLTAPYEKFRSAAMKAHSKLWEKTFGPKSPWKVVMKRGKQAVEWDSSKGQQFESKD